jgi:2,4-dienoyl-CoA reductase-like NADH-dependent reductase (Old Yellow Enzyme family)
LRTKRSREELGEDVEVGLADVVPIGKWALANPDFVARFRKGAELNAPDFATLFGGGAKGYIDYPALA